MDSLALFCQLGFRNKWKCPFAGWLKHFWIKVRKLRNQNTRSRQRHGDRAPGSRRQSRSPKRTKKRGKNCFKGNIGETPERQGGARGPSRAHRYHLELNWTEQLRHCLPLHHIVSSLSWLHFFTKSHHAAGINSNQRKHHYVRVRLPVSKLWSFFQQTKSWSNTDRSTELHFCWSQSKSLW